MFKTASPPTPAASSPNPKEREPVKPTPPQSLPLEETDPVALNAQRSEKAIWEFQEANRIKDTPPLDFMARAVQPLEVSNATRAAEAWLEPGPLEYGAGEAVPSLGNAEPFDASRHTLVDTLQRPTTVSVRASEKRLQLLDSLGLLQSGMDTARTARAQNAIEKMMCHQLAGAHTAAMNLLGFMPGLQKTPGDRQQLPVAEIARLGNTAARLMDAFAAGCEALSKMKRGGTQRVLVQHQQLVVAHSGSDVVINDQKTNRCGHRRSDPGGVAPGGRKPRKCAMDPM
jgi:hypothetical protein